MKFYNFLLPKKLKRNKEQIRDKVRDESRKVRKILKCRQIKEKWRERE